MRMSGSKPRPVMVLASCPLTLNRVLKNLFSPRLLKKVQMQGGGTHPCRMGTRRGARRTYPYVAAPRERGGTHRRWVTADGPFSAAC